MSLHGGAFDPAFHGRQAALEAVGTSSAAGLNAFSGTAGQPSGSSLSIFDKLRAALKLRLRPWTMTSSLTVKDVCRAINASDDALLSWINGKARANIDGSGDLVRFFWSLGDRAFLAEIYGLPPLMPVEEARKPLAEAHALLGAILQREVA